MPLAPTWCVNRAPRAGSGQAENEPTGLSQACISSEGPGQAREVQPPSVAPAYSSPMETCRRTPPLPVASLLSQRPRLRPIGSAPCRLGLVFQRGPSLVPSSPLAPENMGFSPWAGKQWDRLERTSLGSNPGPPPGPRGPRTATHPLWPQFPQTSTSHERDRGSTEVTNVEPRHRICTANLSPSFLDL